jgi:O-antigen ligase
MLSFLLKNNTKSNYLSFLFFIIPISFIAGNLVLNLNIIFFIIFSIVFYGKSIFKINLQLIDKLILLFFSFVLIAGIYNFIDLHFFKGQDYALKKNFAFSVLIKSILYTRYILLYFILRFLIENKLINLKLFFISCTFSSIFVSLDLFYQFTFGKDIFGFEPSLEGKFSGPFDYEYIAGGYLQRFTLFSFFVLPLFYKINNKIYSSLFITFLFLVYFAALLITGNRMPLILFVFMFFLIILFEKELRKYFVYYLLAIVVTGVTLFYSSNLVKKNLNNFFNRIQVMSNSIVTKKFDQSNENSYFKEFRTFYGTWQMNKYIGGGVKSFRINCWQRKNIKSWERSTCNTHPHNYYLEILTDLGIVGFLILSSIFLIVLYQSFIKKYFFSSFLSSNKTLTPFMFLFLIEIFPIKSTGSFFTTSNATFLFLILAITVALSKELDFN